MTWLETVIALRESQEPAAIPIITAAVSEQVRLMLDQVRGGAAVSIDEEPMRMAMRRVAMPSFSDGFDGALTYFGAGRKAGFLTGDEELLRYLQSFGLAKVRLINETTRRMLLEEVLKGLQEGLDNYQIAERLYNRWLVAAPTDGPISMARTENIARTEIGAALNAGSLAGAQEVGMTHKVWSSVRDARTRRPEQRGYDHYNLWNPETGTGAHKQRRLIHEAFTVSGEQLMFPGDVSLGAGAGNVAQCFPAGTEVVGDDVYAAMRSWYDGEIVTIKTASGKKLSGTPNHPVLTDRGWVGLGLLNKGDRVFTSGSRWRCPASAFDVQNVPTTIEKLYDALSASRRTVRVPGVNVDFYGDRPSGDVDIVDVFGLLRDGGDSSLFEIRDNLGLTATDEGAGLLFRPGLLDGLGAEELGRQGSQGVVGSSGEGLPAFSGSLLHTEKHGGASSTSLNPGVAQNAADGSSGASVFGGDGLLGQAPDIIGHDSSGGHNSSGRGRKAGPRKLSRGDNAPNGRGGFSESVGDVVDILASHVATDHIVHKSSRSFSGHVYTISTGSGLYAAEGIVVRNCRCALDFEYNA